MTTPGTMLALGHGYSCDALSRRLVPAGWRVIGTTRSAEKAQALTALGVEPVIWDGTDMPPLLAAALAEATHIVASAAPGPDGDPAIGALGDAILARGPALAWVGYLSTVGVYGDRQGGWVDETSALNPATSRGQARVDAERAWAELAARGGFPLAIFRLAGIYGPGRGPFAKIRRGTARRIVKPGQVFSRIHVEDIATVLEASIARPRAGAIYNVCDNEPAPPEVVIELDAQQRGGVL
ncbi:MAG: SDR family oxidoreductase, partial [Pseudomonadota bacterium]